MSETQTKSQAQTRIRWHEDEKLAIAQEMARILAVSPDAVMLDVVRTAQMMLEEDRRRDIKAWSAVQGILQQALEEAQREMQLVATTAVAEGGTLAASVLAAPAASDSGAVAEEHSVDAAQVAQVVLPPAGAAEPIPCVVASGESEVLPGNAAEQVNGSLVSEAAAMARATPPTAAEGPDAPAVQSTAVPPLIPSTATTPPLTPPEPLVAITARPPVALDPLRVEAALLMALQSPVVESALVALFSKSMAQAFSQLSPAGRGAEPPEKAAARSDMRVLLAGFPPPQAKGIEEALRQAFEVRVWMPGQGQHLFEALAGICSIAVIPEAVGDDFDESLKGSSLRVLRHEGNPLRLLERVEELAFE